VPSHNLGVTENRDVGASPVEAGTAFDFGTMVAELKADLHRENGIMAHINDDRARAKNIVRKLDGLWNLQKSIIARKQKKLRVVEKNEASTSYRR